MEGPFHASHGQRLAIPPNLDFTGEAKFLWNYHGWRGILQVAVPFLFSRKQARGGADVDRRRCQRWERSDRRSTIAYRRARACKAIERRMIQFVRPMSLSGGTPCHGVQQLKLDLI